jgi:heme/copper-type cytochrome/quinol oxidase subunit 2
MVYFDLIFFISLTRLYNHSNTTKQTVPRRRGHCPVHISVVVVVIVIVIVIIIIIIDAVSLINVFKNETDCCSITDAVGLRVPTKEVRDYSTFNVSNVPRLSPSTRCVTAANSKCRSLDIFKQT